MPSDDLSAPYLDHRIRLAQASAADELLARWGSGAAKEGGPAAPATSPVQGGTQPADAGKGNLAVRAARDVAVGAVESPRAVAKGARDAVQSVIDMGKEFGGWIEDIASLPGVKVGSDGIHVVSHEELKKLNRPGFELPDLAAPTTVTGGIIKGVSQFLVGMKGAGAALKLAKLPEAAGAAGYARTALQGAMANFGAFDPHQQRLSNLIEEFPVLKNPVTEYLASDPGDNAAEGRFKNAVEGLGLGVLADGFLKGVRLLREVRAAHATVQPELATAAGPNVEQAAFRDLGDEAAAPTARLVRRKPFVEPEAPAGTTPADVAAAAKGGAEDGKFYINFARIDTEDDIKRVMREMVERRTETLNTARRGKQTFKEIELNAQQQNVWDVLTSRRQGEPLNAEQSLAARQLWVSSSEKLAQVAETAAAAPSEANLFAFRKMLAIHDSIQTQVISARTETARALASWRIPAGGGQERLRDIAAVLDQEGGGEVARELAKRVSALSKAGMHTELAAVIEKTAYARTHDAVIEGWINGLLSNPTTHVVNSVSNGLVMFLRMGERATASSIRAALGDQGGVAAGEATAQWYGLTQGLRDAWRYAVKSARTGESGFGIGKVETPRAGAISSEALRISQSGWLGRGVDLLGQVARIPGRALTAEDEFFKTIGYRMELHAQALRQASEEAASGAIERSAIGKRMAELVQTPPENLRLAAVDAATYQTFTNAPDTLGKTLSGLTQNYPALKVILPFTRTPSNILHFTFERTPLAPLMSSFRANVAAGGARQQLALAQMALGTSAMLTMADFAMSGQITGRGPVEKGERDALLRSGWKPYSVKVGDRWFTYNRLDPIGSLIGMAADTVETFRNAQHDSLDDPDTERLTVAATAAFAGNLVNKTYLSGLASTVEALSDPQRAAEGWAQRLAGSIVPAGVAAATRLEDPYVRAVYSMMDAIRARTPGLSDNLPARMDMWGRPITYESGLGGVFDALSPVQSSGAKQEPIDKEMLAQEINLPMPSRNTSFDGVTVDLGQNPKAYARYVQLAGNELKHPAWGLGAKDLLNEIVSGTHPLSQVYQIRSDGPEGGKDVFIRDIVRQYRELARRQVLDEFPELADEVGAKKQAQRELKMPVLSR